MIRSYALISFLIMAVHPEVYTFKMTVATILDLEKSDAILLFHQISLVKM